jgi:hypothetical protein
MNYKDYRISLINENLDLSKKIYQKNKVDGSDEEAYAFIIACLKILYPKITLKELASSITDEKDDQQIDAIVIKNNSIDIYDFKRSEGFSEIDIRVFRESINNLIFNSDSDLSSCNKLVKKKIIEARKALENSDYQVKIRVVRGGGVNNYPHVFNALKEINYNSIKEHKFYSLKDLIDLELKLDSSPVDVNWNLNIRRGNEFPSIIIKESALVSSLICRINLKEIVDLYYSFQPNEKIFESNVRGMQNNNKISSQILHSLSSNTKASSFYKKHNGLTIVCDQIDERSKYVFKIVNPQIVNGCQTVTTISNFFSTTRESQILEKGSIICKIFSANKKELEEICLASNTQVAINPADLRTNDNNQIILESYLNKNHIKYDRKATRINKNNEILFKEIGQWFCSCFLYKPAFAKNSKAQIFSGSSDTYKKIYTDSFDLKQMLKIVEIGIFLRNKIKSETKIKKAYLIPGNLHILTSLFYLKDKIVNQVKAFDEIEKIIKIVADKIIMETDFNTYPKVFTKNDKTWDLIKKELDKKIIKNIE